MAQKKVLVTLQRAPVGTIFYTEGLRAAVGITSGTDEHEVNVVWQGDGVWYALDGIDRSDSTRYLDTLKKLGAQLLVEEEALAERGVAADAVAPDLKVVSRARVLDLLGESDLHVDL